MSLPLCSSSPSLGQTKFNFLKTKTFFEALHWGTPNRPDVLEDLSSASSRLVWLSDAPKRAETLWENFHKPKDCRVELHILQKAPELFQVEGRFDQVSLEWEGLADLQSLEKQICFFRSASRHLRKGAKLILIPTLDAATRLTAPNLSLGEVLALAKNAGLILKGATHLAEFDSFKFLDLKMKFDAQWMLIFERP